MNLSEIKKIGNELYAPIFALENIISHNLRRIIETIFKFILILSAVTTFLIWAYSKIFVISDLGTMLSITAGVTCIFLFLWLLLFIFEAFYYSYYYQRKKGDKDVYINFDLAFVINSIESKDIVRGFFKTKMGQTIIMRSGISSYEFNDFLEKRKNILSSDNLKCTTTNNEISLPDFLEALVDADAELSDFFFKHGIQKNELTGISEWVKEINQSYSESERWWSKENLSRIPGVGKNLSYGEIYNLEKYSKPLSSGLSKYYRIHSSYGVNELKELEAVLSRKREANVILIGNDEEGILDIIQHLSQIIDDDSVVSQLKNKRIILIDGELIISKNGSKAEFESEFIKIMQEAIYAGNVLLVIQNLPSIIASSKNIGVDFQSLLESYLKSQSLQIIATSGTERFHEMLERDPILSQHFENILVHTIDDSNTIKVLQNELVRFESEGLLFTYPAVIAIADGATRYFPDAVMPDKAIDILLEIAPKLINNRKWIVEKSDVSNLLEAKTGIPLGELGEKEKEKLLNLEEILHKRIIGQNEAITAISSAVRRARSGVANPNRPLGSFLFLGPTGVGKTETTKVLADAFFGEKAKILRLDMSEYSSSDATSKLIGSFQGQQEGVLSTMLREHPYGVLLLDEFEKTTQEVMNLFLQILDEGFFSDMKGSKISTKNLIIIATSNAGSDLIWDAINSGTDLTNLKDTVIETIIKQGIFKPELLNRFDGVILFHPLTNDNLRKVAEIMLQNLNKRLSEKGYSLDINDDLLDFVMSFGIDPKFGARPMNRAIQEKVEEVIAKKIIEGTLEKGSHITLTKEELK